MDKLTSLSLAVGTLVTQEDIDSIYEEANLFPDGSREKRSFVAYAKRLEKRLEEQKKME